MIHLPSGRVYIGQRKIPRNKTIETDSYFGSGKIWKQIYKKHPDECIKVIIDFANTKDEIDELEKKYIAHYKSVYEEFCVNITDGGQGGAQKKFTDEELKEHRKIANAKWYENNKEHWKISHKKWCEKNTEYIKEYKKLYAKEYYQLKKEKIKKRMAEYYKNNKEQIKYRVTQYNKKLKSNK